jgi:hypothetical protein
LQAVIFAVCVALGGVQVEAQEPLTQYGRKRDVDKGPRAVGLVQIPAKGKARFTPIAIMIDGEFYDAGSYKATPVPMALEFGTVYEGFRSGVSQGLFTITQPGELNHNWIAEGTWLPAGAIDPHAKKKYAAPVIMDDPDGPPVLHRRKSKGSDSNTADKDTAKDGAKPGDAKGQATPASSSGSTTTAGGGAPAGTTPASSPSSSPSGTTAASPGAEQKDSAKDNPKPQTSPSTSASNDDENIQDPNRPRLRRGKPDASTHHEPFVTFDTVGDAAAVAAPLVGDKSDAKTSKDSAPPQAVVVPAISDVGGPDPRPYLYDVKTSEVAGYRNQMLALAAVELNKLPGAPKETPPTTKKTSKTVKLAKSPQMQLDDLTLRFFDLSNSNEPVLVLSGKTQPPPGGTPEGFVPKEITLIARTNLENEAQKLFFSATDAKHLDMTPRMQLIDAVDADGDGRGELLFRRTFDTGSAYAIYRVTADGLWPLFEGTP